MNTRILQIKLYVESELGEERSGHDYFHIQRVVKLTKTIAASEKEVDEELVIVAAYLHDVADDKVVADPNAKKTQMRQEMTRIGYSDEFIKSVFEIIANMSFSANLGGKQKLSIEGQVVQDADRIDAIGAIGIARTFYYGGHFGDEMYDPQLTPRTEMTKEQYRQPNTVINHFYEKLLKIKDQLNTATAKKIAESRQQVMLDFLQEFYTEWNGTK